MKTNMGLWIDHRRAVIVAVSDKGEEITEIPSHVEKQQSRMENIHSRTSYKSGQFSADDKHEREFRGHLNIYYDQVVSCIKNAESILIMGPGMAKNELKRRIEKNHFSERIADIESADKMPERQIAAKVRQFFVKPGK